MLTLLPSQIIIQVLVFAVMPGLVNHTFATKTDKRSPQSYAPPARASNACSTIVSCVIVHLFVFNSLVLFNIIEHCKITEQKKTTTILFVQ